MKSKLLQPDIYTTDRARNAIGDIARNYNQMLINVSKVYDKANAKVLLV